MHKGETSSGNAASWKIILTKKLSNSQPKEEIENFIQANLRIITQEIVFQKALRTVLPIRGQGTVICVFKTKGYT